MHAQRRIRSFVLRAGRVTAAQDRALSELWPVYGIDVGDAPIELTQSFPRPPGKPAAARCLEIGFGTGELLGSLAAANPHNDYVGIEVHRSGVGRLLLYAERFKLANLRVVCHDAVEVMKHSVRDESFDEILVFFPDPWHKKRHHKRRLLTQEFVALLVTKMTSGGILRLATDWQDYAEQMLAVCNAESRLQSLSPECAYVERPDFRPPTRFEKRGARLGHPVWDLAYVKRGGHALHSG